MYNAHNLVIKSIIFGGAAHNNVKRCVAQLTAYFLFQKNS